MKKSLLLGILMMCSALSFAFDGSGTADDPYQIRTADELIKIRTSLSSYYILMNDIDLSQWIADNYPDAGWAPIGSSAAPFTGNFNGDGHTITNLNINRTTTYNGLFGYVSGSTIKNLNVSCDITGGNYTGSLVGYGEDVTISSCSVEGKVKGGDYTGGIISQGYILTVYNCSFEGDVNGGSNTGGIVGYIEQDDNTYADYKNSIYHSSTIYNSYVKGNITSTGSNVGGIIGQDASAYGYLYYNSSSSNYSYHNTSNIHDLYFDGNVTSTSSIVGGIVGYGSGEYRYCYSKGAISGSSYVGGIAGKLNGISARYSTTSYYTYTYACIYSCVCLCSKITSNDTYVSRICNIVSYTYLGTFGTTTENRASSNTELYKSSTLRTNDDSQSNGYAISDAALHRQAIYTDINWDFTNYWAIDEEESYPYLQFESKGAAQQEETAAFDFTKPAELSPAVTPNEEEDAGVNITKTTFENNGVSLSFGLGTRTQTYSTRLWTNDDDTYALRTYQNGTMTISTGATDVITSITFAGDDVTLLSANTGTISGGVWTGEASSVTFTIGATYNKINTIDVSYRHDGLLLTDTNPTILNGTFAEGKAQYTRLTTGDYASFCLPFDIDLSAVTGLEQVYMPMEQMIYNTSTGYLMMFLKNCDMTSTIKAGTPFLAKVSGSEVSMSNSSSVTYKEIVTENPAAAQMMVFNYDGASGVLYENSTLNVTWGGTYVATEATDGMNSFNINGTFGQHTGTLNPFRAYIMETSAGSTKVRGITTSIAEADATSIFDIIDSKPVDERVYNLQGQRITDMQKGHIYIINGRKVLK